MPHSVSQSLLFRLWYLPTQVCEMAFLIFNIIWYSLTKHDHVNIIGTPSFFSIAAEMRDPRQYTRSLLICQSVVTAVYLAIGCVVYYYCGSYVASPAHGSAGRTVKKISYGFALPGLLVTTMLVIHVSLDQKDSGGNYVLPRLIY